MEIIDQRPEETIFNDIIETNINNHNFSMEEIWKEAERRIIFLTLVKEDGDIIRSARTLGTTHNKLTRKLSKLGVRSISGRGW